MSETPPFVPVGTDHALAEVVIGVAFNEPLSQTALETFRTPDILKDDLPSHLVIQGQTLAVRVGSGASVTPLHVPAQDTGIERVEWQRFNNGGQLEWKLGVEKNRVFVTCHAYTRWRDVADQAYGYLDVIFRALQSHKATANAVVHQCVDEFYEMRETPNGYRSLLDENCPWLAPQVLSSTGLFHNNVGWFEANEDGGDLLVRVHIEALPTDHFERAPASAACGVRITSFLRTDPVAQPFALSVTEGSEVRKAFEAMHVRSKELISTLLTSEMNRRIGLAS